MNCISFFSFLVFSVYKDVKSNHYLLFLEIFFDLEMMISDLCARCINYTFILDISEIAETIYIWVLPKGSESVLLSAFIKYTL